MINIGELNSQKHLTEKVKELIDLFISSDGIGRRFGIINQFLGVRKFHQRIMSLTIQCPFVL